MLKAFTNEIFNSTSILVTVRKYLNIPGRGRGFQKEIIEGEVKRNGAELLEHLKASVKRAIPHFWDMCWGEHASRQSCPKILNILSDFSAVLDHDFQDRLNCAIPAHSNQDVFIVSHSPRQIEIGEGICHRIQENNVWNIFAATRRPQALARN